MQGKVTAGVSTLSLGGVSLAAYVAAVVAFFSGTRDEVTVGTAAIGTVALLGMAAGRFWQAVEKIRNPAKAVVLSATGERLAQDLATASTAAMTPYRSSAGSTPSPHAAIHWEQTRKVDEDEPGDPDALPDYATEKNPAPDDGDTLAGQAMRS